MYGTYYELSKENILKRISPLEIFRRYVTDFRPNVTIISPFGEKNPSFWTIVRQDGSIYFKDYGSRSVSGDCFDLVMYLHNENFPNALARINRDFCLNLGAGSQNVTDNKSHIVMMEREKPVAEPSLQIHLQYTLRGWTNEDSWYWLKSGCNLGLVSEAGIQSAGKLYVAGKAFPTHKFAYIWHTHGPHVKFYQPFASKKYKWRSSTNNDWLQNESRLPEKGSQLILQSSLKDSLCVESWTGIPGVAPNSETAPFPASKLDDFEKRFDEIFILFDTDTSGVEASAELSSQRGYKQIILPKMDDDRIKDPSSFCWYGETRTLIKSLNAHGVILRSRQDLGNQARE